MPSVGANNVTLHDVSMIHAAIGGGAERKSACV